MKCGAKTSAVLKEKVAVKGKKADSRLKRQRKVHLKVVQGGSEAARRQAKREERIAEIVMSHRENGRKLARSILRRWRVRMPGEEVDSIVDLALCEAARRFSEKHGAQFMTFFFYHLRGHLVRAVARAAQSNNIFVGFAKSLGIDPAEWDQPDAEVLWTYAPDNAAIGRRELETPEHLILRKEQIEKCRTALQKLDDLEREVLRQSYGNDEPLVDVARGLGYSRCHISRVKKTAMDRLRVILEQGVEAAEATEVAREQQLVAAIIETPMVEEEIELGRTPARRRARRRVISERVANAA